MEVVRLPPLHLSLTGLCDRLPGEVAIAKQREKEGGNRCALEIQALPRLQLGHVPGPDGHRTAEGDRSVWLDPPPRKGKQWEGGQSLQPPGTAKTLSSKPEPPPQPRTTAPPDNGTAEWRGHIQSLAPAQSLHSYGSSRPLQRRPRLAATQFLSAKQFQNELQSPSCLRH